MGHTNIRDTESVPLHTYIIPLAERGILDK